MCSAPSSRPGPEAAAPGPTAKLRCTANLRCPHARRGPTAPERGSAHPATSPSPSLGVHLWARPDSDGDAVLAEVEGAWRLAQAGAGLSWTVTCADGTEATIEAADVLAEGLWAEVDAVFADGHLRLTLNGDEVANERAACFELMQAEADLVVGEGFVGGLDELAVGALAFSTGAAGASATLRSARRTMQTFFAASARASRQRHGRRLGPGRRLVNRETGQPGDQLSILPAVAPADTDGAAATAAWLPVERVTPTGAWSTVYNLRVADFHTYFVTPHPCEFGVWVHNQYAQGWQRAFGRTAADFDIPEGAVFRQWFDSVDIDELDRLYSIPNARDILKSRLRNGGASHEWLLVSRGNTFRRWGVTFNEITENTTPTTGTFFRDAASGVVAPHGTNAVSARAHQELAQLIDSSNSYAEYQARLRLWADSGRLPNGVADLPANLR